MWAEPVKKSRVLRSVKHTESKTPRIFTKLKIGTPGDKYEQEADRVANYVMRSSPAEPIQIQTEEEEDELQMKPSGQSSGLTMAPPIQKEETEKSEKTNNKGALADAVGGLLKKQLSDKSLKKHLKALGEKLKDLAVKETGSSAEGPTGAAERLTALNIPYAFETTSKEMIADPGLKELRQQLIDIVGSDDEAAMLAVLAAGLAAVLADVGVKGKPSTKLGAGFSLGGMFDLGSARDLKFNEIQSYLQYANEHFKIRLTSGLKKVKTNEETGEKKYLVGTGTGDIRIGSKLNHFAPKVSINSDGEVVLTGQFSAGTKFGKKEKLVFTTDITHKFATGETLFKPGVSGKFDLGGGHSLKVGSKLELSSKKGLDKVTGYLEYKQDHLLLRFEGSMKGLKETESIMPGNLNMPGNEMLLQGRLVIPFD